MTDETSVPHRHRMSEERSNNRLFKIRNILNTIFLIGAVVGVAVYYFSNHAVGITIVLFAMVPKMVECCLRFFHK